MNRAAARPREPDDERAALRLVGVDGFVLAMFVVAAAIVPLWLTHRAGALGVPRSDDWSYLRTLFEWRETGEFDFNDWVSMTLLGQLVLSAPVAALFDDSITAMRVLVAVLGVIGLGSLYVLARRVGATWWAATLAVGGLALGPLWGPLAASYMTDVPGFAFQAIALAAAVFALHDGPLRRGWWVVALAAAVMAVAIRQYSIVPLTAIVIVGAVAAHRPDDRTTRRFVIGSVVVAVVGAFGVLAIWNGIPHRLALEPRVPNGASLRLAFTSLGGFLRLAGLLQLPLVLALGPFPIVRRAFEASRRLTFGVGGSAGAALVASWALSPTVPFVGNYLDRRGTLADDIIHGNRPDIVPRALFELLTLSATLAAVVLVVATVPALERILRAGPSATLRSWRDDAAFADLLVGLSLIGFLAAYELAILVRLPIFDRYALVAVPLAGIALVRADPLPASRPRTSKAPRTRISRSWVLAGGALAMIAILGATFSAESAEFDAGRWHAAELAVEAGLEPRDIDAGYEWSGWYRGIAPGVRPSIEERKRLRREYVTGLCVQVVIEPSRPPRHVVAQVEVDGWFREPAILYVVPTGRPCASGHSVP